MIKELKKKLKSHSGETISETLVGLLIAALALVMLAGSMSAASSAILKSKDKLEGAGGYYSKAAELMELDSGSPASVTIKGTNLDATVSILFKENKVFESKPVIAYKKN